MCTSGGEFLFKQSEWGILMTGNASTASDAYIKSKFPVAVQTPDITLAPSNHYLQCKRGVSANREL